MSDISVIIPTYNRIHLLKRALDSVMAQKLPPKEIIVVDDGSTDSTAKVVEKEFPDVRYIQQEHQGVSRARNYGLELSTGEWVCFLDSDDAWLPEKLQRQMAALQRNTGYLICHTNEIWIRNGKRVNPKKIHTKYGGYIYQKCLPLCIISPSSVMIHRTVFKQVGTFDETLPACEDYDLWLRICARYPVLYIDEPLIVKYGGHADQLSRQYWGMDRFRIYALEKMLTSDILTPEDKEATRKMLIQKIQIYLQGARKRDKEKEVEQYQKKLNWIKSMGNEERCIIT